MSDLRHDLTRVVLSVLFIGVLIAATFWILRPFLGAMIWATMIVVASWPMMLALERWFGGRRWAAVTVMSVILLLVLVVPLSAAVGTLLANADTLGNWAHRLADVSLPPPPAWLENLPLVGERAARMWRDIATGGFQAVVALVTPYAGTLTKWAVARAGGLGALFLEFLLTVVASALLYANGEEASAWALRFGERLGGVHGTNAVRLSGQAIRGVALGVVVTALVQTLIGGLGLLVTGVPFAALLMIVMFLSAVAQIGAALVLVIPVVWLYWSGSPVAGSVLLVITLFVGALDNVLRPILIKRGADLPLILIFIGVIGGLIAFGLIGIFVGPVVLAVAHTLMEVWMDKRRTETS